MKTVRHAKNIIEKNLRCHVFIECITKNTIGTCLFCVPIMALSLKTLKNT